MTYIAHSGIACRRIVALVLALIASALAGALLAAPANASPVVNTPVVKSTIEVGSSPTAVAVSPDGTRLYVATGVDDSVSVMTATGVLVTSIAVGDNPQALVLSPDGTRLYVANMGSANVSVIDTTGNTVVATISVGTAPRGVAMAPSGNRLYVSNSGSNNVSEIDTTNNTVVTTIPVGTAPIGLGVSPNGLYLYVANYGSANVSVIYTSTRQSVEGWPQGVGFEPLGVAVGSNGYAYVTRFGSSGVVVISGIFKLAANTVPALPSGYVDTGGRPSGVAVSPDGSTVYVANNAGGENSVSVLNSATLTRIATVPVGSSPFGIAAAATGGLVYVGNSGSTTITVLEPGAPPVNTELPRIFGTATKGVTLSATPGTWTYAPTYAYQWQTCTTADCTGGTIADVGTNQAAYQLAAADVGKYVRARVTASNGNAPNGVAYSAVTMQVADIENGFVFTTDADGATIRSFDPTGLGAPALGNMIIPSTLGGSPTRQIGNAAFHSVGLTGSVTIPDPVTHIGDQAFWANPAMTGVQFGTSQTASQLTDIGDLAFDGPGLIGALLLPNSLLTIGTGAFSDQTGVTSVSFGTSQSASRLTSVGSSAFAGSSVTGTLALPDSLTTVEASAFYDVGDGVTYPRLVFGPNSQLGQIGANAFNYPSDDTTLVIPDSVTQIGFDAFRGFDELTSLTFGDGTATIGDSAFRGATSANITFTGNEPVIAAWAFHNDRTLTRWQGSTGWDDSYSVGGVTWPVQIAAPTVTSITPASGGMHGDQLVTITGTGFAAGAMVSMGRPATDVVVIDSRTITAQTPIGDGSGPVGVTVTNLVVAPPIGTGNALFGSLNSAFTYLPAGPMTFSSGAFPTASVGSTTSLTVTVTNSGAATVPTVSVTGAGVSRTGGTCAPTSGMPVNGTCSVELTWAPTVAGALGAGALTVSYPFGDQASSSLPLSGTATAAPGPGPGPSPTPTPTPTPTPPLQLSAKDSASYCRTDLRATRKPR